MLLGKYLDHDANEEDIIIPKIEIINYDSFSSANRNYNSILNAVAASRIKDKLKNRNKDKINFSKTFKFIFNFHTINILYSSNLGKR